MTVIEFQPINRRRSEDLFNAPSKEAKWANVINTLLSGQAVFVPGMPRTALESLRSIINYRQYGSVRSRWTEVDGVEGRLIELRRGSLRKKS